MSGTATPSIERPYGWIVVVTSLALMTIGAGSQFAIVVALKPIAGEFGWPRQVPSLAYGLSLIGMGVGGMVMGRWSDRVGMALPAAVGILAVAAGAYLVSLSDGRALFLAAHGLLIGLLGNAALFSPLVANATRWFDRRRGIAVAIVASGQFAAGFVWPLVFRPLIETVGWRQMYESYALFVVAAALPLCLLLRPRPPVVEDGDGGASEPTTALRPLGLSRSAMQSVLCCAGIGCCLAMAVPMVHLVAHTTDLGFPLTRGAQALSVLLGCGIMGRLAWGAVSDRIGGMATLVTSSALQLAALLLFVAVDGLGGLFVAAALFGLAFAGIVPSYSIVVREVFPLPEVGGRIGTVYLFTTIGMAAGGYAGGLAFDLTGGYLAGFAAAVAANLAHLALVLPLLVRQRRLAGAAA
jgi:MFS family permease